MVSVLHVQSRWPGRSKEDLGHPGERQMAPLHEKPQASHPPWGAELGYMLDAAGLPWCLSIADRDYGLVSSDCGTSYGSNLLRFLCQHKLRSQASAGGFDFASSL